MSFWCSQTPWYVTMTPSCDEARCIQHCCCCGCCAAAVVVVVLLLLLLCCCAVVLLLLLYNRAGGILCTCAAGKPAERDGKASKHPAVLRRVRPRTHRVQRPRDHFQRALRSQEDSQGLHDGDGDARRGCMHEQHLLSRGVPHSGVLPGAGMVCVCVDDWYLLSLTTVTSSG